MLTALLPPAQPDQTGTRSSAGARVGCAHVAHKGVRAFRSKVPNVEAEVTFNAQGKLNRRVAAEYIAQDHILHGAWHKNDAIGIPDGIVLLDRVAAAENESRLLAVVEERMEPLLLVWGNSYSNDVRRMEQAQRVQYISGGSTRNRG